MFYGLAFVAGLAAGIYLQRSGLIDRGINRVKGMFDPDFFT